MRSVALLLLAALAATASAQGDPCSPLPLPPGGEAFSSDHGVTNPALLNALVKEVDEARVFPDSKTIVDMPLKAPPAEVAAAFGQLALPSDPQQRNQTLFDFIQQWMTPPGSELIPTEMNFTAEEPPAWFSALPATEAREWAYDLYKIWGRLARRVAPEVAQRPELYTLLPVQYPFVVPGARFREVYYWDSYFVLQGLLASNLTELAQDIVRNFIYLIAQYGHSIPNGIRTYYLNRSQPPLFSDMVRIVYESTANRTLLSEALPALLREYTYWSSPPKQVAVPAPDGRLYNLSRYYARWTEPRPESYIEDVETARQAGLDRDTADDPALQLLYRNLASAAESGWDFSTRWFADGMNLTTIRTTSIIPADLNAFLLSMEQNIADFAAVLGCADVEQRFRQLAANRREALDALFWGPEDSQWHDLVCTPAGVAPAAEAAAGVAEAEAPSTGQEAVVCDVEQNPAVFASNWAPLWAGAVAPDSPQALAAVKALNDSGLVGVGGVAMSLTDSGQQWDYPNVWPPIQFLLIDAAARYGGAPGDLLAREQSDAYLNTAHATYQQGGRMYEKFDTNVVGQPGGGGEYEVVDGFGWSNGVALALLLNYGGWQ